MTFKKLIAIGLVVIGLVILTGLLTSMYWKRQLVTQTAGRTAAELYVVQFAKAAKASQSTSDSIASVIKRKDARIKELESIPPIIIQANDQNHLDIDRLNAYNSIVRFTDNAAKYRDNTDRYRLHRFIKHRKGIQPPVR